MSDYQERGVHAYFARATTLVVASIGLVSLLFVGLILLGHQPSSVTRPELGLLLFGTAAASSAVAALRRPTRFGFSFVREGLPFLLFPIAMWGAGNESSGPPVMLAIGILANLWFWWANGRHDVIEERHHRVLIPLRWRF